MNSPFGMIGEVLLKMQADRARGAFIVSAWRGRVWWHVMFPDGSNPADFVSGVHHLPMYADLFLPGTSNGNTAGVGTPPWQVLALYVNCA